MLCNPLGAMYCENKQSSRLSCVIAGVVPETLPVSIGSFIPMPDLWCGDIWGNVLAEGKFHYNTARQTSKECMYPRPLTT